MIKLFKQMRSRESISPGSTVPSVKPFNTGSAVSSSDAARSRSAITLPTNASVESGSEAVIPKRTI